MISSYRSAAPLLFQGRTKGREKPPWSPPKTLNLREMEDMSTWKRGMEGEGGLARASWGRFDSCFRWRVASQSS